MAESSPKQIENTVGKGEIAHYEQLLVSPQCFQKTCTADTYNQGLFGKGLIIVTGFIPPPPLISFIQ